LRFVAASSLKCRLETVQGVEIMGRGEPDMKAVIAAVAGAAVLVVVQWSPASAEDACPDRWAKLPGTYKCEGPCNYTASVCTLPEYATGYKRWRFAAQGASVTGVVELAGSGTIAFATTSAWTFTNANTSDCGETIQFDGTPKGVTWRRVDSSPSSCGGGRSGKRAH
jgi:hypothetical protein